MFLNGIELQRLWSAPVGTRNPPSPTNLRWNVRLLRPQSSRDVGGGKPHRHRRPRPRSGPDLDRPSMGLNDLPHNAQPKPRPRSPDMGPRRVPPRKAACEAMSRARSVHRRRGPGSVSGGAARTTSPVGVNGRSFGNDIALSPAGFDDVGPELLAEVRDVDVEQVRCRLVVLVEQVVE